MKKFLAILLSLILGGTMLAFAACSDGGNTDTPSTGNEQTGGETADPSVNAENVLVVYYSATGNTESVANLTDRMPMPNFSILFVLRPVVLPQPSTADTICALGMVRTTFLFARTNSPLYEVFAMA